MRKFLYYLFGILGLVVLAGAIIELYYMIAFGSTPFSAVVGSFLGGIAMLYLAKWIKNPKKKAINIENK